MQGTQNSQNNLEKKNKVEKHKLQPKCPSAVEWLNKTWCIYRKKCYSAIKRNEVLTYATRWMNLENIKWKKPYTIGFRLYKMSRTGKSTKTEDRLPGTARTGKQLVLMGTGLPGADDNFLELDTGDNCTIFWIYEKPLNYTLKQSEFFWYELYLNI